MKLSLFALVLSLFVGAAHAETRHLNVYRDTIQISNYHTHIKMKDVQYRMLPKVIRIVPGPCHSEGDSDCTRAKVIKKVPVVQVTVEYRDGLFREENSYRTVDLEFNLPASKFTKEQIETLKRASRFSLSGKNCKVRQAFLVDHLRLDITKVDKPTWVIDESRSKLCDYEDLMDRTNCEEDRHYKTQIIEYKKLKVSVK